MAMLPFYQIAKKPRTVNDSLKIKGNTYNKYHATTVLSQLKDLIVDIDGFFNHSTVNLFHQLVESDESSGATNSSRTVHDDVASF